MRQLLFLAAIAFPILAAAQQVTTVEFDGQPTVSAPAGDIDGCGLRFFATSIINERATTADIIDGSVAVYVDGIAGIKAGLFEATIPRDLNQPGARLDMRASGARVMWVRVGDGPALKPLRGEVRDSPSRGYQIYPSGFEDGVIALAKLSVGEHLWVAFKSEKSDIYQVFAGPLQLSPRARQQYDSCFSGLRRAVEAKAKSAGEDAKR